MLVGSIILAGGRSRRMGRPKESLPLPGGTMLSRIAGVLAACSKRVVVVARDRTQELPRLPSSATVVFDERPDEGPLPALALGLRTLAGTAGGAAFVTAVDAPFVAPAVVELLAQRLGDVTCAMPRVGDRVHPLCAVYRLDCATAIDAMLRDGLDAPRRIPERVPTNFVGEGDLRAIDPELLCLLGCNTESEFEAVRQRLGGRS